MELEEAKFRNLKLKEKYGIKQQTSRDSENDSAS